jgi:hydrogenase maturation protein HypF
MIKAVKINLEGIVQGVGFRPFVHRLALLLGLNGAVLNTSCGVEIAAEGNAEKISEFYKRLHSELPPLAKIIKSEVKSVRIKGYKAFSILESKKSFRQSVLVSPDICICSDCLKELFSDKNRRYLYPFINCTNCGPRFSIIKDLPYDRPFTTMKKFRMCPSCRKEYLDIRDRRYHAQPDCCPECGPQVRLLRNDKTIAVKTQAILKTISLLKKGGIIAIKGIGGFHMACDAMNLSAVKRLRSLKNRPFKPFALMAGNIKSVKKLCSLSGAEKKILSSPERPIVLLKKKINSRIIQELAPDNNYLGIMLAYAPLHYLLFSRQLCKDRPIKYLVMTSANIADEPIETDNSSAVRNLSGLCDYFLIHDRDIYNRIDDSIVQVMDGRPIALRRARGYSPFPFLMARPMKEILACGAELKNTFCLSKDRFTFLSQYIGDLKTFLTFDFYKETVKRLLELFCVKPKVIAYDLHPDYLSTRYALESKEKNRSLKLIPVQHHRAHLASVIAEHRIKQKVIGVCFDGIGFGSDSKVWGGEFFTGGLKDLKRASHLEYVPMPGGDKATQQPYRMGISYLYNAFGRDMRKLEIGFIRKHRAKINDIINAAGINPVLTSSAGRLFDAVSSILGICDIITYEAQAAIRLQMFAEKSKTKKSYRFLIQKTGSGFVIKSIEVISGIALDLEKGINITDIARKFHNSMAIMAKDMCVILRDKTGSNTVCLSGGVFQNKLLLETLAGLLRKSGFKLYYNELLPTNDGAVSLGQAAIANEICA